MAEPVQSMEREMLARAAETADAFRKFVFTGKKEHLDRFQQNLTDYGKKKRDPVFIREFTARFQRLRQDALIDNIVTSFENYQRSLLGPGQEYAGFKPTQLALAVGSVYSEFGKLELKAPATSRAHAQPSEAARKAFEDFLEACRQSPFGKAMAEERLLKMKPPVKLAGRAAELTNTLNRAKPDLIAMNRAIENLEGSAKGTGLAALAKGYRQELERLNKLFEQAFESGDIVHATKLVEQLTLRMAKLREGILRAAQLGVQAENLAANFDYAIRTGNIAFPIGLGASSTGYGGAGAYNFGGFDAGIKFYDRLSPEEKDFFMKVLISALKKTAEKRTDSTGAVVEFSPLYDLVERYAKARKIDSVKTSLVGLVIEAARIQGKWRDRMKEPDGMVRFLESDVPEHLGNVGGSTFVLDQMFDRATIAQTFKCSPEDVLRRLGAFFRGEIKDPEIGSHQLDGRVFKLMQTVSDQVLPATTDYATRQALQARLLQIQAITDPTARATALKQISDPTLGMLATMQEQLLGLDMVTKYYLVKAADSLNNRGMADPRAVRMVVETVLDIASRDRYLVPAFVDKVVLTLADTARTPEDFSVILAAVRGFVTNKLGSGDMPLPGVRRPMLAWFQLVKDRMPEIKGAIDHYSITEEMTYPGRDPEMPGRFQLTPTFLERATEFPMPQYMPRVMGLTLRPPSYVPPDTGGVNFTAVARSSALAYHLRLLNMIYASANNRHAMRVPLQWKIKEVGLSRMLREFSKLAAQYDEGRVYPAGPALEWAAYGGLYAGKPNDVTNLEAASNYLARLKEGMHGASVDARRFGTAEVTGTQVATNWGKLRSSNAYIHYLEANNILEGTVGATYNLIRRRVEDEENEKAAKEAKQPRESYQAKFNALAKKLRTGETYDDAEAGWASATKGLKDAGPLSGAIKAYLDLGESGKLKKKFQEYAQEYAVRIKAGKFKGSFEDYVRQEERIPRKPKVKPGYDMIVYTTGYREHPDGSPALGRVKGRLFLVDTAGNRVELRAAQSDYVWFENYLYGRVERERLNVEAKASGQPPAFAVPVTAAGEVPATQPTLPGGYIFRRESGRMYGFEGAILGFTIDKDTAQKLRAAWARQVSQVGVVGTVQTMSGTEAYINWGQGWGKVFGENQRHAIVGIYRGMDAAALTLPSSAATTGVPTLPAQLGPTYPAYQQHSGELIYRYLRPRGKPEATSVEARLAVGADTKPEVMTAQGKPSTGYGLQQLGGRLLIEYSPEKGARTGYGLTGGYVEHNLQQEYAQLQMTATGLYTQMKTYLAQVYGWKESESGKWGRLAAVQFMYSNLFRPAGSATGQPTGGMEALSKYPYYGAALFMLWAEKWKVVAGASRTPGYDFSTLSGVISNSFANMGAWQDRQTQAAYMTGLNTQLQTMLTMPYDTGSIGITSDGKVLFETTASWKMREDLGEAYGDLESIVFFNKQARSGYLQLMANLVRFQLPFNTFPQATTTTAYNPATENVAYLTTLLGIMVRGPDSFRVPDLRTSWFDRESEAQENGLSPLELRVMLEGKRSVSFTVGTGTPLEAGMERPEQVRGVNGDELRGYLSRGKKDALRMLLGKEPSEAEENMALIFTKRAEETAKPATEYHFRVVRPVEEGKEPYIEIGIAQDAEQWKKDGFEPKDIPQIKVGNTVQGRYYTEIFGRRLQGVERNNTVVQLSRRLEKEPSSRSKTYYALLRGREDEGVEGYTVLLGNEADYKEWKRRGHELGTDVRRISMEPDAADAKRMKSRVEGVQATEWVPAIKIIGGPILRLSSASPTAAYAGYEVQGLVEFFRNNRLSVIFPAIHYAKLKDQVQGLEASRLEFGVSAALKGKKTLFTDDQLAIYILGYQDRVRVVLGTPNESKSMMDEWKKTGGTIGFEWKRVTFGGRDFSVDTFVDGGLIKVPTSWLPATAVATAAQSPSYGLDLRLLGYQYMSPTHGVPYVRGGAGCTWSDPATGRRYRVALVGGHGPSYLWMEPIVPMSTVADLAALATNAQMFSSLQASYIMAYFTVFFGGEAPRLTPPSTISPGIGRQYGGR